MGSDIGIGIVGVGRMGSHHAAVCSALDNVELVAVCDLDTEKARAAAGKYGCACESDYRDMADKVDAVVIAAPTSAHRDMGVFFLSRGVPVLIVISFRTALGLSAAVPHLDSSPGIRYI